MSFDKIFNSKIFNILETIYRVIVLNILTILFTALGLVIFSLVPALIALTICIKSINNDTDFPLIKSYFYTFKANYVKGIKLSIFYLVLIILCIVNTYYLYCAVGEWGSFIWIMLYTIMLIIDSIVILSFINLGFVYSYFPKLSYFKMIKYSFVFIFVLMGKELIVFILLLGSIYLVALFPYIFIFIVIGLIYYFTNALIKNDYLMVAPKEVKSLDVFCYINQLK